MNAACPREWRARLTAKEYAEAQWIMEHERGGPDRRDLGIVKAAVALLAALGREHKEPANLLPVPPPKRELTPEEEFAALEAVWPSR